MSERKWTAWESVSPDDPRGQPSAAYRGLVCYVSTDPCLAVVTADGSAVPPDQWPGIAHLIAAAPDLFEALDPEALEAIADEIDCFEHSARAAGLRGIAKRQRAALSKALGQSGGGE